MIDQCYIPRNVLDSLLNVGLQGLLFGDDDFQFPKVGGLHYERSNYYLRQCLLAFVLCELILLLTPGAFRGRGGGAKGAICPGP